MYSSAVFEEPTMTLEEASQAKLKGICEKLELSQSDHLLEIGTGWGGLAIHAAREYGCQVTTTTISSEQYQFAQQRVREEGLEDRITVLLKDYRDLTGQFSKTRVCRDAGSDRPRVCRYLLQEVQRPP